MKEAIHFNSLQERLAYIKHGFDEIKPKKAEKKAEKPDEVEKIEKKPKKSTSKAKKMKKGAKQDEVQAE